MDTQTYLGNHHPKGDGPKEDISKKDSIEQKGTNSNILVHSKSNQWLENATNQEGI